MTAGIIDGTAIAAALREEVTAGVASLVADGKVPGLAVVLVGEDPASQVYVRNKARQTVACGMRSFEHRLAADLTETALLELVGELNADPHVDGILVQLPLPAHIDASRILLAIDPSKDADGFHPINVGLVATGNADGIVPCTPLGAMRLIRSVEPDLAGRDAVIVGKSNIVGKPMAQLLMAAGCTVTVASSRTRDLPGVCRRADILVAAAGRPQLVRGDWIRPGAIVIDVGINRVVVDGASRLVGDVQFAEAMAVAGAVTPVPGGVGPMTIACLLSNTLDAAKRRHQGSRNLVGATGSEPATP